MSAPLAIRPATASDVDIIYRLLLQLADSTGQRHKLQSRSEDFLKHGFAGNPQFDVLLAEQNDTVIGLSLFFYTFSSWRGKPGVYIQDLVVDRNARGRGIGRALIVETIRCAIQKGATHLRLSVEQNNRQAIGFYNNLGLRESESECIYAVDGDYFLSLAKSI